MKDINYRSSKFIHTLNDLFDKTVQRECEETELWLEEIVEQTDFGSSSKSKGNDVPLLPKTPSQKAKKGRKRKPVAEVDLSTLNPQKIHTQAMPVPKEAEKPGFSKALNQESKVFDFESEPDERPQPFSVQISDENKPKIEPKSKTSTVLASCQSNNGTVPIESNFSEPQKQQNALNKFKSNSINTEISSHVIISDKKKKEMESRKDSPLMETMSIEQDVVDSQREMQIKSNLDKSEPEPEASGLSPKRARLELQKNDVPVLPKTRTSKPKRSRKGAKSGAEKDLRTSNSPKIHVQMIPPPKESKVLDVEIEPKLESEPSQSLIAKISDENESKNQLESEFPANLASSQSDKDTVLMESDFSESEKRQNSAKNLPLNGISNKNLSHVIDSDKKTKEPEPHKNSPLVEKVPSPTEKGVVFPKKKSDLDKNESNLDESESEVEPESVSHSLKRARLEQPKKYQGAVSNVESEAVTDTESESAAPKSRFFTPLMSKSQPDSKPSESTSRTGYFNSIFKNSSSKPLANLTSSVSSFIKKNTPVKMAQKDLTEKLKTQEYRHQEALQKKDELLKQKVEEQKRKREEWHQKVAAAKEQQKIQESQQKKKIEEKRNNAETLKESELKKQKLQKQAELEAKKKADEKKLKEEAAKLKFKQEVEQMRKKKEEDDKHENLKASHSSKGMLQKSVSVSKMNPVHDASSNPESYAMTPLRQTKPSTANNYDINDLDSGDETDDADAPKKKIPSWALGNSLKADLVRQYYSNTDVVELFGRMLPPDLSKMGFKTQSKRLRTRTSSGKWNTSFYPFADAVDV